MTRERVLSLTAAQVDMAEVLGMTPAEYATELLEARERNMVFQLLAGMRVSVLRAKHLRRGVDVREWKTRRVEVMKRFKRAL